MSKTKRNLIHKEEKEEKKEGSKNGTVADSSN